MDETFPFTTYFVTVLEALEHARVADFVRYVQRQLREDKTLADLRFKDGWLITLGGYAEMAAATAVAVDAEED